MQDKIFKYKLDFYYQQTLIYFLTLVVYAGIFGNFVEEKFSFVFKDPMFYIIILFLFISIIVLILNIWRSKKLIIENDKIIFLSKHGKKIIDIKDIEWIYIGKDKFAKTAGYFQQVSIKIKGKPFSIRIRVGRYERNRELIEEMEKIAQNIPHKKKKMFNQLRKYKNVRLFKKEQ